MRTTRRSTAGFPAPGLTRVVVLTGGSSGIGLGSALQFAREGWRVGLIARNRSRLEAAASLIAARVPGAIVAVEPADVTDAAGLAAAARALVAALGPIDAWVNAAGNGVYGHFASVPEAEFRRVTEVTYLGTVNGCRVALSHMTPRDQGVIVNVCSAVVFHGVPLMSSYSGAKAAVRAFAQSLTLELALVRSAVRISTLFPPAINTPFFDHAVSHMGFPARPVPPVYRTGVAARGVVLCASGRGERRLTGVVFAYSLIARLSPGLAGYLVSKSDFASELPRDGDARDAVAPCLFDSHDDRAAIDGPFMDRARGWSLQLWLIGLWRTVAAGISPVRRDAPSPPAPVPEASCPARAGSASQARAASDSDR